MRNTLLFIVFGLGCFAIGCSSGEPGNSDARIDTTIDALDDVTLDVAVDGASDAELGPPFLRTLESLASLDQLASGLPGVKWLGRVVGRDAAPPIGNGCLFQNPARWMYHLPFLLTFEETRTLTYNDYVNRVLRRSTRVWWGGELGWRAQLVHPILNTPGTLVFTFYTEDSAGNRVTLEDIREVTTLIRTHAAFAADRVAFSPNSSEQASATRALRTQLESEGIAVILLQ